MNKACIYIFGDHGTLVGRLTYIQMYVIIITMGNEVMNNLLLIYNITTCNISKNKPVLSES